MSFYHSAVEHTFINLDVALIYPLVSLEPCKITGHITLIKILAGLIEFGTRGIHFILKSSTCSFSERIISAHLQGKSTKRILCRPPIASCIYATGVIP